MTGPQLLAYLLQVHFWLVDYKVELEIRILMRSLSQTGIQDIIESLPQYF